MDRLDSMSTLLAAVECGSLSAASRKLGMPLATVSRRVSELEAHLRTRLVNRTSRRLALTDAGRSYVAACKKILEAIGEAERAAAGEYSAPRGDLTVTAPIVFGRLHVLPAVLDFLNAYPEIDLRLVLTDRVINLFEEPADLAVRIGTLADSSLIAARAGSIRRVICASPAYFAARGTPQSPHELAAHDCITFEGLMSPKSWAFRAGKSDVAVPIHSRLTVNTAEAAVDAAIAGAGVTRPLSYQIAKALEEGTLVTALEEFEPMPVPVSLVYQGQGQLALKLRAFLEFAGPRLKARLASLALSPSVQRGQKARR
jgi:DNA-binding transcriptional LysR family regulator